MPKRGDRAAPPARAGEWELRFATSEAASGWEDLCRSAPGAVRDAFETLSRNPRDRSLPSRQHRLKYDLAVRDLGGQKLEQWQFEVTGAGRIWYCIDDKRRLVLLTLAT